MTTMTTRNKRPLKRTFALCGAATLLLVVSTTTEAWVSPSSPIRSTISSRSELNMMMNPWIAGSLAGAIGVGIAHPLDTLKTKQQVLSASRSIGSRESRSSTSSALVNSDGSCVIVDDGASATTMMDVCVTVDDVASATTMMDVLRDTWTNEGISGLFGGVQTSMMGQAVIKSVAFAVNSYVLAQLTTASIVPHDQALLMAAATAGFVTAFLAVPCDRIKVLMQCDDSSGECYCSDWDCLSSVLKQEGLHGLLFRGLGPALLHLVPAYTIYFSVYGALLAQTSELGAAAPLVCGAVAGASCVVPSFPADVVKTLVQNTNSCSGDGMSEQQHQSCWQIAKSLYETQGIAGFWDGLTPRMLRAALNHSVTFATYEWIVHV